MPQNNPQFAEFCKGTLTPNGYGTFVIYNGPAKQAQGPVLPWLTFDANTARPDLIDLLRVYQQELERRLKPQPAYPQSLTEIDIYHTWNAALGAKQGHIRLDLSFSGPAARYDVKLLFDLHQPDCFKFLEAVAELGMLSICPTNKADIRQAISFEVDGADLGQKLKAFKAVRMVADLVKSVRGWPNGKP